MATTTKRRRKQDVSPVADQTSKTLPQNSKTSSSASTPIDPAFVKYWMAQGISRETIERIAINILTKTFDPK